jgi:hypothetical protein
MKILEYLKKPAIAAAVAGVGGILLGLIWGWVIQPVQWVDAPPALLNNLAQETYLRMAIDSYGVNGNPQLAVERYQALGENAPALLATIQSNPGAQNPAAILGFSVVVETVAGLPTPTLTPMPSGAAGASGASKFIVYGTIFFGVVAVAVVLFVLYKFLGPRVLRRRGGGEPTPAQEATRINKETERTDYSAPGKEGPIAQFVTTYVLGDDLFDDTFGVDSPSGEFLGECGVGISETIGVGDPKKVTAFEIWLFDKNDIQTVTKVLMSAHAYNDVATLQRLEAKGEPVLVAPRAQIVLETAALQMMATVADMEYGKGALPDGSYFERLTLELVVWPKVTAPA